MLRSMEVNIDAEYMQVISVENKALLPIFQTQALEALKEFEVIMSVNRGGKTVNICQRSNENNVVVEISIMASSSEECILMHLIGKNLELNNMNSIMNMF